MSSRRRRNRPPRPNNAPIPQDQPVILLLDSSEDEAPNQQRSPTQQQRFRRRMGEAIQRSVDSGKRAKRRRISLQKEQDLNQRISQQVVARASATLSLLDDDSDDSQPTKHPRRGTKTTGLSPNKRRSLDDNSRRTAKPIQKAPPNLLGTSQAPILLQDSPLPKADKDNPIILHDDEAIFLPPKTPARKRIRPKAGYPLSFSSSEDDDEVVVVPGPRTIRKQKRQLRKMEMESKITSNAASTSLSSSTTSAIRPKDEDTNLLGSTMPTTSSVKQEAAPETLPEQRPSVKQEEAAATLPKLSSVKQEEAAPEILPDRPVKQEEAAAAPEIISKRPSVKQEEEAALLPKLRPLVDRKVYPNNAKDLGDKVFVESHLAYLVLDQEKRETWSDGDKVMVQWEMTGTREFQPLSNIDRSLTNHGRPKRRTRKKNPGVQQEEQTNEMDPDHPARGVQWASDPKALVETSNKEKNSKTSESRNKDPVKPANAGKWESDPKASVDTSNEENATTSTMESGNKDPVQPVKAGIQFRYPHAKHCNVKVNRYMPSGKPKPKPRFSKPPPPEMGDVVYKVDQKTFNSRCAKLDDLYQQSRCRVVGESFFAFGSPHERLLQLMNEDTSERFYLKESDIMVPHILDR